MAITAVSTTPEPPKRNVLERGTFTKKHTVTYVVTERLYTDSTYTFLNGYIGVMKGHPLYDRRSSYKGVPKIFSTSGTASELAVTDVLDNNHWWFTLFASDKKAITAVTRAVADRLSQMQ